MLDVSDSILDNSSKTSTPFKNSHSVSLITVSMNGVDVLKLLSRIAILAAVFVNHKSSTRNVTKEKYGA